MAERHLLEIELTEVLELEEEAEAAMRPYLFAFTAAHRALEDAWADENSTRTERLALATARMEAGHAKHPFKVRVEDVAGWRKRIEHQLRAANAVIEHLTKPTRRKAAT